MFSYQRFYQKSHPSSLFEKLGSHSLVTFFSTKVVRGGPRILLHLAASLVVVVFVVKLASDTVFGGLHSTTGFFNWNSDQVAQAVAADGTVVAANDQGSAAGGLRIVVFGEDDVASPSRSPNYRGARRPSWTELLCHELHCTSYLSFTQDFDITSYPVVSQEMHNAAIKMLLDESAKETAGGDDKPGKDYSFYPDKFPIDRARPDLAKQVQTFLAMDKPQIPPSDTLWVFTLGSWDIWSLAGMPTSISKPLLGLLTTHVFDQVELLYRSSFNKDSVAYSKPLATLNGLKNTSNGTTSFRVLTPTLFDPSITPGWVRSRPKLPEVHSKAEQLRNAAFLTDEWNDQILRKLESWIDKLDLDSSEVGDGVHPPQRDGFAYDLAGSLLDTIMNEQLRVSELRTKTQIAMGKDMEYTGGASLGNSQMMDVMRPCLDEQPPRAMPGDELKSDEERKTDVRQPEDESKIYKRNTRSNRGASAATGAVVECRAPDEHLFYSPFELGTRTISAMARQVGAMVLRNESVRAIWAADEAEDDVV